MYVCREITCYSTSNMLITEHLDDMNMSNGNSNMLLCSASPYHLAAFLCSERFYIIEHIIHIS